MCHVLGRMPDQMSHRRPNEMSDSTAEYMFDRMNGMPDRNLDRMSDCIFLSDRTD